MRGQEGGEGDEDDPPLVPRLGTRTGSTLLFSTTKRFSDMKQKRNYSFLTSRLIAKTSYMIRSSGVLLQTGRVFLMTFIVGVKSYMEVSNETSDIRYTYDFWARDCAACQSLRCVICRCAARDRLLALITSHTSTYSCRTYMYQIVFTDMTDIYGNMYVS